MSTPNTTSEKHEPVPGEVERIQSSGGAKIFRIPLRVFPGLWAYVYAILVEGYRVLIDSGSGVGDSHEHLLAGLKSASELAGTDLTLPALTHILITHGHIDHFGGLSLIRPLTKAKIGIHELDKSIVTNHAERLFIVSHRLDEFLAEAGIPAEKRGGILDLYRMTKGLYRPVPVDFTYEAQGMRLGPFEMLHVPGHCPGEVVIRLHDILFSGDHVLSDISPHQAPEQLTASTGLGHYLESLETVRPWGKTVRLVLGGHERPITDLGSRLDAIRAVHMERLQKVLDFLHEAHTIAEVSGHLFGEVGGYNVLLAMEEAGAHVEYLYQRGMLVIDNMAELEGKAGLMPIRYRCLECSVPVPRS